MENEHGQPPRRPRTAELAMILTARGTPDQGANKRVHGAGYPCQDEVARRRGSEHTGREVPILRRCAQARISSPQRDRRGPPRGQAADTLTTAVLPGSSDFLPRPSPGPERPS